MEQALLSGGVSDNVIDASAVTAAGAIVSIGINGGAGNDTLIGSQIQDTITISGSNPGVDTIDGQGHANDLLNIIVDGDIALADSTVVINGNSPTTHLNFERVFVNGGAGDNLLDATGVTAAGGLAFVSLSGHGGSDTIRVSDLGVRYDIDGRDGLDVLDLAGATETPNLITTGPGPIDGLAGTFVGPSSFRNIDQIVLPPEYDFTTASYSSAEGDVVNTIGVVQVTRSVNTSIASSVDVELNGIGATAGVDFAAGPIRVDFLPGETVKSVPVELFGDVDVELDETISLAFANGISGVANPVATLTIVNDDASNQPPVITSVATDATFVAKAEPGDVVTLAATFTDPDAGDLHIATIDWGDGTTSVGVVNELSGTISGEHAYATGGIFDVSVTVSDDDSESDIEFTTAVVSGMRLTDAGVLQIVGTSGKDVVVVKQVGDSGETSGQLKVIANWDVQGDHDHHEYHHHHGVEIQAFDFEDVASIEIHLCDGDDHAILGKGEGLAIPAIVYGGDGDDYLVGGAANDVLMGGSGSDLLIGRGGNDVLVGGDGDDRLHGGCGDDILIGGFGEDRLRGGQGRDLLIGGSTTNEADANAADIALAEWEEADLWDAILALGALIDDNEQDTLAGGHGDDALFAGLGDIEF
ncbi:MAG: hypothetical protein KDB14_23825 [Planctomycetales bacterium]|nr:hypothetical protein [Planctomycetales bacterium]